MKEVVCITESGEKIEMDFLDDEPVMVHPKFSDKPLSLKDLSEQNASTGYIKGITGVSQLVLGGTTEGSADAHVSFVNAIGKIGVAVRDDGASFNNSVNIDASAILDLTSTTRGFLPPRMTSVEMNAISSPATGLMIYDTTTNQWMGYDGTSWVIIG